MADSSLSTPALVTLYIEMEASIARDRKAEACSLASIVHSTLTQLAVSLSMPKASRSARIAEAACVILRPPLFAGAAEAFAYLAQHRYRVLCISPYSESTMQHVRCAFPPQLTDVLHICPVAASLHFASHNVFRPLLLKCNDLVPGGVEPHEILVVSTGVGRMLAPALAQGCATALVQRPGRLEAHVNYKVGKGRTNPMPSITVDGLAGLCEALKQFNFLVSDDDINRSPSNPRQDSETSSDSAATDSEGSSYVSDTDEEAADKTRYIWSFSIRGVYQATQFLGEGANGMHRSLGTCGRRSC